MKHRRDISSVLKALAITLALLVGYHSWLKPAVLVSVPPPLAPSTTSLAPTATPAFLNVRQDPPWGVPVSRLVELGTDPNPTLHRIREELDRGNYDEVHRRLRKLSVNKLANPDERRFVAALWNNLGVQQEKYGGTATSVEAFKQSVIWDPSGSVAHLNLTQAYWELRDPAMTPQFLERVLHLAPQDPFPHLAMADLLLSKGNISQASVHLEHARPRAERDPNHRSYFGSLMAKIEAGRAIQTDDGSVRQLRAAHRDIAPKTGIPPVASLSFSPGTSSMSASKGGPRNGQSSATPFRQGTESSGSHFSVRFDGPPDQATWMRMRAILEYAYEELTQKFGHVPMRPIPVTLHTNQEFIGEGGSPVWADSLFDHSSGTIHLQTQGALEDLALFSRIARHQFVHALLHESPKGGTAVPRWLLEGLALQLAEDPWPSLEETGGRAEELVPLTTLQGAWEGLSGDALKTAYHVARSATRHLVDRYGIYGVRQVMNLLQSGRSFDDAMQQKLSASYEEFERQWQEHHRASGHSSGS